MVLCTYKYVERTDIILSIPTTNTNNNKTNKRTQGHFGRWWICLVPWLWWWYKQCMPMSELIKRYTLSIRNSVYQLYLNSTLKKRRPTSTRKIIKLIPLKMDYSPLSTPWDLTSSAGMTNTVNTHLSCLVFFLFVFCFFPFPVRAEVTKLDAVSWNNSF